MPEDFCSWMLAGLVEDVCTTGQIPFTYSRGWVEDDLHDREVIEMQTAFCGEYVLVYMCVGMEDVTERAVLYNLDRKTWEKVEVPGPRRLATAKAARAEKDRRISLERTAWFEEEWVSPAPPNMATQMTSTGESSESMDAKLWGGLQDHIDLAMVYAKLPIGDFFRLRQVCKEWNRLASDRGFLEESYPHPFPKPYFIVGCRMSKMQRLFYYENSSLRWKWTRLPRGICEVSGLLCTYQQVFNVHTRMFHSLPCLPEVEDYYDDPLMGMTVDTSTSPHSFQVILGDVEIGTRIYDSKRGCWWHKPSTHEYWTLGQGDRHAVSGLTCAPCNGILYIRVWSIYGENPNLHTYNLEKDVWDCPFDEDKLVLHVIYNIRTWQDRVFLFGLKLEPSAITAWELCNPNSEEDWALFDRMPEDLCSWMLPDEVKDDLGHNEVIQMQTGFCGEYVLVYLYVGFEDVMERAVLYNLDQKTWEKVEVPGPRRHSSLASSLKAARANRDSNY